MPIRSVGDIARAYEEGRSHSCTFRKVLSGVGSVAGWWFDLSTLPGNPTPNYYATAPLEAATLLAHRGIWHGTSQGSAKKYLHRLELTASGAQLLCTPSKLCDYLLYYPFIDGGVTEEQVLDNSTAQLQRYQDGAGVRVIAVLSQPTTLALGTFTFDYINQDGALRTSPLQQTAAGLGNTGNLWLSALVGPFLYLAGGDTGVRSLVSITFTDPPGGLVTFVLVKPLLDIAVREFVNPVEFVAGIHGPLIEIEDGAHLNLLSRNSGTTTTATLTGAADFIWSN